MALTEHLTDCLLKAGEMSLQAALAEIRRFEADQSWTSRPAGLQRDDLLLAA